MQITYVVRWIRPPFLLPDNVQVQGTAMGTGMAPFYAKLFMGKLECEFLWTQDIEP